MPSSCSRRPRAMTMHHTSAARMSLRTHEAPCAKQNPPGEGLRVVHGPAGLLSMPTGLADGLGPRDLPYLRAHTGCAPRTWVPRSPNGPRGFGTSCVAAMSRLDLVSIVIF